MGHYRITPLRVTLRHYQAPRVASSWTTSGRSVSSGEQHTAFLTDTAFVTKAKDPERHGEGRFRKYVNDFVSQDIRRQVEMTVMKVSLEENLLY